MTRFYMDPDFLDMWMKQNDACILDAADGCLLDNMLVEVKRGYAAIYEHGLNEWSSNYYVEFQATKAAKEVFDNWFAFYDARRESA